MLQDEVFFRSEGDSWFTRNRAALDAFDPSADLPLRLLDLYALRPQSVLEVGAANGARMAAIHRITSARTVAVEPSMQAIHDGRAKFPVVTFVRGTADALPLQGTYDLVIVNFVFHWVDRLTLLRSVAEVDRLVCDGGFLIVGDFQPTNRLRVPYHHLHDGGVYTYKQDYAELFRSTGLYHSVCMLTAHHGTKQLDAAVAENQRIGAWLLRKELSSHYFVSGANGNGA